MPNRHMSCGGARLIAAAVVCALSSAAQIGIAAPAAAQGAVNIYSYRQPYLIQPLLKRFTEETGIKTNIVYASKGLGERIKAEGVNSPVDVMLTVGIGRLENSETLGFAAPLEDATITDNIPANFRDPDNRWCSV